MRLYAIGDVHGHLDKLTRAHAWIEADRRRCDDAAAPVVHLGDYYDRGPDSAGVIAYLAAGVAGGAPWRCIRGNHDAMLADFLAAMETDAPPDAVEVPWLGAPAGGAATLASYGIAEPFEMPPPALAAAVRAAVPEMDRRFLAALEPAVETEALFLTHAGIRPGVALNAQDPDDLMWIRWEFLDDPRDHGKLVVHGHTPVDAPMHCGNRVALDTGAAYGGPLTAAVFEGRACWVLTEAGRAPLSPPA